MVKSILLSFFLLLFQLLAVNVVQAQEYPGFTSWNKYLTDTLKCDGVKVICLPALAPKRAVFYTDLYCGTDYCINPTGVRVYSGKTSELYQFMQTKLNEYNQKYPQQIMQIFQNYNSSSNIYGDYYVTANSPNNKQLEGFSWRMERRDGYCEFEGSERAYVEGLGCMDENTDRTSMTDAPCEICSKVGNPFDVRNGAKYEHTTDITFPIVVSRNYISKQRVPGLLGKNWKTNFDKTVRVIKNDNIITTLLFINENGEYINLISNNSIRSQYENGGGNPAYRIYVNGNIIKEFGNEKW